MLKITVIILASIISAVFLQDVNYLNKESQVWGNQPQNQDEPCISQGAPAVEKQVVPLLISSQSQPLPQENLLYEPKIYEPKEHKPKVYEPKEYEPKIYEPKAEKYEKPKYVNNRRNIYPNPTLRPTDEIVDRTLRHTTEKITTKDCHTVEKQTTGIMDPLLTERSLTKDVQADTRRSFGDDEVRNDYKNDYLLENNFAYTLGRPGGNSDKIDDPISRPEVSAVSDNNKPLLINNPRVCYACSSASNPTCWEPNRRTTIKYCHKDHASCVTKTFGEGPTLTLIRDCATSCVDNPIPGLEPKYKSCKVCHSDLCNSAFSIKSYKILYVLLLFTALKFTF